MKHTLQHAVDGCGCRMSEIFNCVICGKNLEPGRVNVDTCGSVCFRGLLRAQRERNDNVDEDGSPLNADNDPDA